MVSSFKMVHCMPHSATLTPFRAPIPAISHFDLYDFRPKKISKFIKNLQNFYYRCFVFNKETGILGSSIQKIMFKYS